MAKRRRGTLIFLVSQLHDSHAFGYLSQPICSGQHVRKSLLLGGHRNPLVCLAAASKAEETAEQEDEGLANENDGINLPILDENLNLITSEGLDCQDEYDEEWFLLEQTDGIIGDVIEEDLAAALDLEKDNLQDLFSDDDEESEEPMLTKEPISIDDLMSLTTNKNTDIAYFFLQNEIGIAEEDMWKITHEAGSILGMTASNLRRKIDLMRRLMDLTDDDVRTMLKRHPAVLHLSAKQNVAPTILFLQRSLDLSREDLRCMIVQFPSILGYSLSNLNSKLNFYLKLCRFTKEEARKMFCAEPKLLTAGVKTGLVPHFHFFVSEAKMSLEGLREMVQKNPRMFLYSVEQNLRPKIHFYLVRTLGMDLLKVQTLLRKYPQFIDYNLDNTILPITQYLVQDLLFSKDEFSKILFKFPRLVTWSLYKIKHVVGYLRYELGMDASQTKRVLFQAPQVINLNTENTLKPKVEFFRETFHLSDPELRRILAGMPTLTICSLEANLKPKIEYLTDIMGNEALKMCVLKQPTLLGYSLDKRIRPRMELLQAANVDETAITIGIPMKEAAFMSWLDGRRIKAMSLTTGDAVAVRKAQWNRKEKQPAVKEEEVEEPDGRIVHWTRERKQPSTASDMLW